MVFLLSLLRDSHEQNQSLVLPHTGLQKDRLMVAIRERNLRISLYGQPELSHYCNKCVRFYFNDAGDATGKVSAVVTDGLTLGHPCCGIHNCQIPLQNNRHRFCQLHRNSNMECSITTCSRDVLVGHLVCDDPGHLSVEALHTKRGQAFFQLKDRLARAQIAHPNDSTIVERPLNELEEAEEEEFDVELSTSPVNAPKKLKARFGRRRTHNEQIIVAPCGIITARETFYGAEAVGSVGVRFSYFILSYNSHSKSFR